MKSIAPWVCAAIFCGIAQGATLDGTYELVPAKSDDIAAVIEKSTAKMNFIIRPIARGRLKKTNSAYDRIRILRSPSQIEVAFDAAKPVQMSADGSVTSWTRADGEVFDVSAVWQDARLVQSFQAKDGKRVNTFQLGEDGKALRLDVVITSDRLPAPVSYSLTYKRAE